jgi:rRNA-processing protein FCF1
MLVTPLPGIEPKNLLEDLRSVHREVSNLRGGGSREAYERLLDYLNWATNAVERLGYQISSADLDRLVLTRRYEQLLAGVGSLAGTDTVRLVNLLVSLEQNERIKALEAAITALKDQIDRWSRPGVFVVADTSVYLNEPEKLEDWDLASHLPIWEDPIHLLVPMVVVDELDTLKLSKDRKIRWRARHSLSVLDTLFQNVTSQARLRAEDFSALANRTGGIPRGEVTAEVLFDPPGHVRLPINDDEMVDRTVAVKALAGRQVTVLTYDTNQSMRARAAGLAVIKIPMPPGEEPEQPTKTAEKK